MGRIDAPPPRPTSPRAGAAAWKIASGVLAAVVLALGAYEFAGRRRSAPVAAAPVPAVMITKSRPPAEAAPSPSPASIEELNAEPGPTLTPLFQGVVMEVTIPRPSSAVVAAAVNPTPEARETLHEEMARCLVFDSVPDMDSWHPFLLQLKVQVKNRCDVTFAGPEVWFEVRAVLPRTRGTAARETGRFQEPIPARGLAETHIAMRTVDPEGFSQEGLYRFETKLWWASGGGRNAGE